MQRPATTLVKAPWYEVRRAQSSKPSTYTCPFCRRRLPAMTEHVLIRPAGDGTDRRHAHTACTLEARQAGRLPSREEWRATQPRRPGRLTCVRVWVRHWRAP